MGGELLQNSFLDMELGMRTLIAMGMVWLAAMSMTTAFGRFTLVQAGVKTAQRHALVLVAEAQLTDLASQVERSMTYVKQAGLPVEDAGVAVTGLKLILEEVRTFLGKKPAGREQHYETIEGKLRHGQEVAKNTLRSLTDRMKGKYPWFRPHMFETDTKVKSHALKRDGLNQYFYGTRIPGKFESSEMSEILSVIEPFQFDFLEYGYKPKKVNRQEGGYNWRILDGGLTLLQKHGYPMSVPVNFGTMKAWPLMKKFSWIPEKYPESAIREMLFQNDRGEVVWRSGFHSVLNIWHPTVLKYEKEWLHALGTHCQGKNVAIYELFNEIGLSTKKRPVGYSRYARASFGRYLSNKYETIDRFNKALGGNYSDFGAVRPPLGESYSKESAPIGLIYEFERFRKESLVEYMQAMISELKEADTNPRHVVSSQFTGWFNDAHNPKMCARDFLKLACLNWDLYGVHCAGDGKFPAITLLYHYCINRYAKKIYWNDEFWWDYREAADEETRDEAVLRAVAERNMWRHIAYGVKGFNIFPGLCSSEPGGLLTSANKMRYATAAFPLVIRKINKHADVFLAGHVVNQKIGIMQPTTTIDITGRKFLANENAMKLSDWILSEHVIPFYIPEECIMDGSEDIDAFRVLISPYAPFVPKGLWKKINTWVKGGGIFVRVGPFGCFDPYGGEQDAFAKAIRDQTPEEILRKKHGKGRLVVMSKDLTYAAYLKYIQPALEPFKLVSCDLKPHFLRLSASRDRSTGERKFYARSDIDLVPWEDKQGNRYLFVINLNTSKILRTTIEVKGPFSKVLDLSVDGGMPVPALKRKGSIEFPACLKAGQGVIYRVF